MTSPPLPICPGPLIRGYLRHAYLFSILGTRDDYMPWALSGNYTQLVFDPDPSWMPLDFYAPLGYTGTAFACPFLDRQWIDRNLVNRCFITASAFLDDYLAQGYYAAFAIDEFYVPGRAAYQRTHFMHRVLVYGTTSGCLNIIGYDAAGNYAPSLMDRDQLDRAFRFDADPESEAYEPVPPGSSRPLFTGSGSVTALKQYVFSEAATSAEPNRIWLVRHLPGQEPSFDLKGSLQMLADYVSSTDSSRRFRMVATYPNKVPPPQSDPPLDRSAYHPVFGMRIYDELIDWLDQAAAGQRPFSLIPFHILLEHKQVMHRGLQFMECCNVLRPERALAGGYQAVVDAAAALKLIMLRQVTRRQPGSSPTVRAALGALRDLETRTLSAVLEAADSAAGHLA